MLTTLVGMPVSALDTPALLVDIETMDRNIAHIASTMRQHGVQWRPHAKGHKCPAITHRQMAAGAIGVTVAKVSEAEVMAASGVMDILIANQVVGPIKTRRLAALIAATGADVIVCVDNPANVRELDDAAAAFGVRPRVLVEVDSGMKRCGVAPGEPTVALAKIVDTSPHLRFSGLMAWEGHATSIADTRNPTRGDHEGDRPADRGGGCLSAPPDCPSISSPAAAAAPIFIPRRQPGITEVQAGGATMGDGYYRALESPVEPALTLLTTVTSRPAEDRIIVDAGRRAIDPSQKAPVARGVEGVQAIKFSAEHGVMALDGPTEWPRVGDRIELEVNYTDQAVHLHESLFGIRDGVITAVWPVACRGRMQ